jgi:hypothetical protein
VYVQTSDAREHFEQFLASRATSVTSLDARSAVESTIDFYVNARADDVDPEDDGDMLLFQWGTYDWGDGPAFEYDITRQLITGGSGAEDADNALWQLSLTLEYEPNDQTQALGSGEKWCSGLAGVDELRGVIETAPATIYARRSIPRTVELHFGPAG